MMLRATMMLALTAATILGPSEVPAQTTADASAQSADDRDTVVVRMIEKSPTSFAFEPSRVTVRPGQTVRFLQAGMVPHNVEFKDLPDGVQIDDVKMGPFVMVKGEAYDVQIDDRFREGTYEYICTPHIQVGMKGTIIVKEGTSTRGPTDGGR